MGHLIENLLENLNIFNTLHFQPWVFQLLSDGIGLTFYLHIIVSCRIASRLPYQKMWWLCLIPRLMMPVFWFNPNHLKDSKFKCKVLPGSSFFKINHLSKIEAGGTHR